MTMIEEPQNARSRRTAAALLDAAREIIEKDGLAAMTMGAVAARAGVSRRAVYLHFASRGELLSGLYDRVNEVEGMAVSLPPVDQAPDAVAALNASTRRIVEFAPHIMATARTIKFAARTDQDAARHWQIAMDRRRSLCRDVMQRLAAEDRLATGWTVGTATEMMLALISLDVVETMLDDNGWTTEEAAGRLAQVFHATFVAPERN